MRKVNKPASYKKGFLGIDTSNYRTSCCLLDEAGRVVYQRRPLLLVPQGKLGLRQQEAVFQHLKALPLMFEEMGPLADVQFGVTTRPRPVEGSYMPCFVVGESFVRALAAGRVSCHQPPGKPPMGWSLRKRTLIGKPFIAVHLSGGTTEFLHVTWNDQNLQIKEVGQTTDISADSSLTEPVSS